MVKMIGGIPHIPMEEAARELGRRKPLAASGATSQSPENRGDAGALVHREDAQEAVEGD